MRLQKTATARILTLCNRLRDLKREEASINNEKNQTRDEILTFMGESETLIAKDGTILATQQTRGANSMQFDVKRFAQDHPQLYKKYQIPKEGYKVLMVK